MLPEQDWLNTITVYCGSARRSRCKYWRIWRWVALLASASLYSPTPGLGLMNCCRTVLGRPGQQVIYCWWVSFFSFLLSPSRNTPS